MAPFARGISGLLPLTMDAFGSLDWAQVGITYGATLLMAAAYVSVGMFWSSMTRDQNIPIER